MSVLDEIVAHKRIEMAKVKKERPMAQLKEAALQWPAPPSFIQAIRSAPIGLR